MTRLYLATCNKTTLQVSPFNPAALSNSMTSLGISTLIRPLFHFFVCRLFAASVAKLLGFHPFCMLLFVFGSGVIAILAIAAL
jgi:hypothetical protein